MIAIMIMVVMSYVFPTSIHHPKINTKLTNIELGEILYQTHHEVFNAYPSNNRLAMAWAHTSLETGQGKKIYNYNIGNIHAGKKQTYYMVAGYRFKSYESPKDGALAYWNHLKNRCHSVLPMFDSGNVSQTSSQLYRCKYYGADVKQYTKGMQSLYYIALTKIVPEIKKE